MLTSSLEFTPLAAYIHIFGDVSRFCRASARIRRILLSGGGQMGDRALIPTPCGLVSLRSAPTAQPALPVRGRGEPPCRRDRITRGCRGVLPYARRLWVARLVGAAQGTRGIGAVDGKRAWGDRRAYGDTPLHPAWNMACGQPMHGTRHPRVGQHRRDRRAYGDTPYIPPAMRRAPRARTLGVWRYAPTSR